MPALTQAQRRHPAQAALNKLPDGWEELTEYYVDALEGHTEHAGRRLLALMHSFHNQGAPWTVGRILRYLRDWQPEVLVKVDSQPTDPKLPRFQVGGKWTEYTFPERDLIVAHYRVIEAERALLEAVKAADVDDEVILRARDAAGEMPTGMNVNAMILGWDVEQWLTEWGQRNGYQSGMEEE